MTIEVFAPAKINLTLHVTGQRRDGYHLLDSLVVFVDIGDRVSGRVANATSLIVDGPMTADVPTGPDNLVLRAAGLFGGGPNVALRLTKNLPTASGIGGGSSDAAATLRVMTELTGKVAPDREAVLTLGSDVPVCLMAQPVRMKGVGDELTPVVVPSLYLLLVNPGVSLATPQVFSALGNNDNPPMPSELPVWTDATEMCDWLTLQRNDLQASAVRLAPEIQKALDEISKTTGCRLSRMSGSGATCFGLYDSVDLAAEAAHMVQEKHPAWWVKSTGLWQLPS
ncbi:MAG: 4-(cytidine 5'-diphospho)-2-C-methyl-D-erythritol kinase [Paracoccaceae bacterium]